MPFARTSGVLLHPTSLPGSYGIGDLGNEARAFLDWLAAAGQRTWQVLPLGPTGYGDSPYQCFSAFAGNPLLISPAFLAEQGLLSTEELAPPDFPTTHVDYGWVIPWKNELLRRAYQRWAAQPPDANFAAFISEQSAWLRDFAFFMALKSHHDGQSWNNWPRELALREPEALAQVSSELADEMRLHEFLQYQFFGQWAALKQYANQRGISIIGDIPIFVAYDSADVWANPQLFDLNEDGLPRIVAGVPPDYFSATGQLWGNPLYRWEVLAERGYDWWIARVAATLRVLDIARIDHFRGFVGYWAVPQGETTAINGAWLPGPGAGLFEALRAALGANLPIIAEDLGIITPDVELLRDSFALPGMRILQFGFADETATLYLPHNYVPNCVAYTGTHDNDTTVGWFATATPVEQARVRRYLGSTGNEVHWDMIRFLQASVANTTIVPLQDLFGLGNEARMNTPGMAGGNWQWRFGANEPTAELAARLNEMALAYERVAVKG